MNDPSLVLLGLSLLGALILAFLLGRRSQRRMRSLERDLQELSNDVCQMAEIQMEIFRRLTHNIDEFEERLLDLSLPQRDTGLPLERRRRVLTLARKGGTLDEIVSRAHVTRGEAELILGLKDYVNGDASEAGKRMEQRNYVQA